MDLINFIFDPGLDAYFVKLVANNVIVIGAGIWLCRQLARIITPKWTGDDEFWDNLDKTLSGVRQRKYEKPK